MPAKFAVALCDKCVIEAKPATEFHGPETCGGFPVVSDDGKTVTCSLCSAQPATETPAVTNSDIALAHSAFLSKPDPMRDLAREVAEALRKLVDVQSSTLSPQNRIPIYDQAKDVLAKARAMGIGAE